jgi:hypothetical protein
LYHHTQPKFKLLKKSFEKYCSMWAWPNPNEEYTLKMKILVFSWLSLYNWHLHLLTDFSMSIVSDRPWRRHPSIPSAPGLGRTPSRNKLIKGRCQIQNACDLYLKRQMTDLF